MRHRSLFLAAVLGACGQNQSVVGSAADASSDIAADLTVALDAPDVTSAPDVVDVTAPLDVVDVPAPQDVPFRCATAMDCAGRAEGPACDAASGRGVPCTTTDDPRPSGRHCGAHTRVPGGPA